MKYDEILPSYRIFAWSTWNTQRINRSQIRLASTLLPRIGTPSLSSHVFQWKQCDGPVSDRQVSGWRMAASTIRGRIKMLKPIRPRPWSEPEQHENWIYKPLIYPKSNVDYQRFTSPRLRLSLFSHDISRFPAFNSHRSVFAKPKSSFGSWSCPSLGPPNSWLISWKIWLGGTPRFRKPPYLGIYTRTGWWFGCHF